MTKSKNQTITAKIIEDWSIADLRYAFPVQLRPRPGVTISPTLVTGLFDLSKISKGQIEQVRKLLRDAVRERCKRSKESGEAFVTAADVHKVRAWMTVQLEENERGRPGLEMGKSPNDAGSDRLMTPPRPHRSQSRPLKPATARNMRSPLVVESIVPGASRRRSHSRSFPRLEDIGIDPVRPVDHDPDSPLRATGETMSSSPPTIQKEQVSLALLRRTQLEADMHRLLAQEDDHRRRAEEYRIGATRHERKALALRMQVADIELELARTDEG